MKEKWLTEISTLTQQINNTNNLTRTTNDYLQAKSLGKLTQLKNRKTELQKQDPVLRQQEIRH